MDLKHNTKIVLLFLEKLESLTTEERREILNIIKLINNPIFVTSDASFHKHII